jgi:hypothetical protein
MALSPKVPPKLMGTANCWPLTKGTPGRNGLSYLEVKGTMLVSKNGL